MRIIKIQRVQERGYPLSFGAWVEFWAWDSGRRVNFLSQTPVHTGPDPVVPSAEIRAARLEAEQRLAGSLSER